MARGGVRDAEERAAAAGVREAAGAATARAAVVAA